MAGAVAAKYLAFTALAITLLSGMAPPSRPVSVSRSGPSVNLNLPARHPPDVLRFRVIANGDTPWDQAVKMAVRNQVLAILGRSMGGVHSTAAAEARIRRLLPVIKAAVSQVLRTDKAPYHAHISLAKTVFPTKAYGTWVLPAGRYQALVIRLGAGRGHNWWCVLFPSLCFVDLRSSLAVPVTAADPTARAVQPETPKALKPAPARPRRPGALRVVWWVPPILQRLVQGL